MKKIRKKSKKQKQSSEYSDMKFKLFKLLQKVPIGLLNIAENVFFSTHFIQVLNSIPSFRNCIHELSTCDPEIQALKCLFLELQNSSIAFITAKYLQVLYLNNYIPG